MSPSNAMIGIFWGRLKTGRGGIENDAVGHLISCATIFYSQTPALVLTSKHINVEMAIPDLTFVSGRGK